MKSAVVIVAADHGVGNGDAQATLTRALRMDSPLSVAVRGSGAAAIFVDAGAAGGVGDPGVVALRGGDGTGDIRKQPAMSPEAAAHCYASGLALASALLEDGIDTLALGQIGDGGKIAARALLGHQSMIDLHANGPAWDAVRQAVARAANSENVVAELGGFDIAVLAGIIAGAASATIILDDVATWAAAVIANPDDRQRIHIGHLGSCSICRAAVTARFGDPILSAGLGSGDGTGAALALRAIANAPPLR